MGVRAVPEVRFPSVAEAKYRILRRTSLGGGEVTVIAEITAAGEATTYVDTEAGVSPTRRTTSSNRCVELRPAACALSIANRLPVGFFPGDRGHGPGDPVTHYA
jgi:hypothetical protein